MECSRKNSFPSILLLLFPQGNFWAFTHCLPPFLAWSFLKNKSSPDPFPHVRNQGMRKGRGSPPPTAPSRGCFLSLEETFCRAIWQHELGAWKQFTLFHLAIALSGKLLEGVSQKLGLAFQRGLNEALYIAVKSWQQCICLTVWEWLSNYRASRRWDTLHNFKMAPSRLFNDVET